MSSAGAMSKEQARPQVIDLTSSAAADAPRRVRVVVLNEQRLFADVLRVALSERGGFDVCPTNATLARAAEVVRQTRPDVVVMDLAGDTAAGLEVLAALKAEFPGTQVLIVTASADATVLPAAVEAGASGYLTMDATIAEVVEAVEATAAGKAVLSGRRLEALIQHLARRAARPAAACGTLTEREREVLRRLVEGQSTRQISMELCVSPNTARTHIQNVLTKMDAHSRLEAAARAVREKLV